MPTIYLWKTTCRIVLGASGRQIVRARQRYYDHLAERLASGFCDTVGEWCEKHGIALTGHMMEEPTLGSQSVIIGEAMRNYRSFKSPVSICCAMPMSTLPLSKPRALSVNMDDAV